MKNNITNQAVPLTQEQVDTYTYELYPIYKDVSQLQKQLYYRVLSAMTKRSENVYTFMKAMNNREW